MNKQLRRLALALIVCYVVLFVQLNRIQIVRADAYNNKPDNNRQIVRDFTEPRGKIITADGVVVAESVPVGTRFRYLRQYPLKDLFANPVGFFSFKYGTGGIEQKYNDLLAGRTDRQVAENLGAIFGENLNTGDVKLTLRADLQEAAKKALGNNEGSVVVMDPRTGALLALWSWPSYDPNLLSTHNLTDADAARALLLADKRKPLLDHTYQERYMPGSTFKIITTTAALETGASTPGTTWPVERSWVPPQTTVSISNYAREACGGTMLEVFFRSCNIPFAKLGVQMGADTMVKYAELYGFNQDVPIDLPAPAKSYYPPVSAFKDDAPKLAQTSFGQNDDLATPLQMAMAAAAVANNGVIMTPYAIAETVDSAGRLLSRTTPRPWRTTMGPDTNAFIKQAMIEVARQGTARCCLKLANGVQAAAKTGTAQLGTDPPLSHAWITTFAPADAPRVVVTVFVKATPQVTAGVGGTVAGPIAKQVLDAALALPDPLAAAPKG